MYYQGLLHLRPCQAENISWQKYTTDICVLHNVMDFVLLVLYRAYCLHERLMIDLVILQQ